MTDAPIPDGLPPWLQTLLYVGGLLGASAAAWKGWISKAGSKPVDAPAAIVAGDIMSTKPMADLAAAVERLNGNSLKIQDGQEKIIDAVNRLCDAERATETAIRDMARDQSRGIDRIVGAIQHSGL